MEVTMIGLMNVLTILSLFASACTVGTDIATVGIVDSDPDISSHNSCYTNSAGSDCSKEKLDEVYTYIPGVESESVRVDKLSDKDVLALGLRDTGHWQAANQETLKQVLFIHRHGDRTPIVFPPKDNIANESFWQLHGLGQLTNRGKARLHVLGKIIRQRYDKFLEKSVNKNFRKSKSSGSLRCIESAQVFLSSFLSLDTPDSSDSNQLIWDQQSDKLARLWQPASVNTLAAKYDGLLNEGAICKSIDAEYAALDESETNKALMRELKHERDVLEQEYGFVIDHFYKWFWVSSQIEVERSYFKDKMKPAIQAIYDKVIEAGEKSLVLFQTPLKIRRARVGLLINDMINNMVEFSQSSPSPFSKKFVHYSAHDINLVFLLGIFDNIDKFPFRPDYASNIMVELHEDKGEHFVKLFYMAHVPSKVMELHIDACEQEHQLKRCTLGKFSELMRKYRVSSWWSWMQECDNSLENMDPYNENS